MMSGFIQKVNPFKASSQVKKEEGLNDVTEKVSKSGSKPSLTDHRADGKLTKSKQNPGLILGLIHKVNPFRSSSQVQVQEQGRDEVISSKQQTTNVNKQEPDLKSMMSPTTQESEAMAATKEGLLESSTLTESSSPKTLGFEWDHFKKDSCEVPAAAEMSASGEGSRLETNDDDEGLLEWWESVEGWTEWNESTDFEGEDAEQAIRAAADRVFMAARLFVRVFHQREALLWQRILELLEVADAADSFHKKTVTASLGGGVASVAGSITTITGLALAPFTFGTSLIVTAVGIGVATAGGLTSASANITDTMHSRTDRGKVEQIILSYQEEIKDIKECLQFLQAGMETLEQWNFEQYVENISSRAMNKNVKHVVKEGGRAGKALLINAERLASTVQVLGTAGGAARAVQALSVASGIMAGLFLALDLFFLAKDSVELHKGAKTQFAAKIREVCRELQDGLVELRNIKKQLEAIMEGADEEEEEEEEGEGSPAELEDENKGEEKQ